MWKKSIFIFKMVSAVLMALLIAESQVRFFDGISSVFMWSIVIIIGGWILTTGDPHEHSLRDFAMLLLPTGLLIAFMIIVFIGPIARDTCWVDESVSQCADRKEARRLEEMVIRDASQDKDIVLRPITPPQDFNGVRIGKGKLDRHRAQTFIIPAGCTAADLEQPEYTIRLTGVKAGNSLPIMLCKGQ